MANTCIYCQRPFHSRRGLSIHQTTCSKRKKIRLQAPRDVHDDQATLQASSAAIPVTTYYGIPGYCAKPNSQTLMDDPTGSGDIHLPLTELTITSTPGPLVLTSAPESSRSEAHELLPTPEPGIILNSNPSVDDQPRSLVDHLPSQPTDLRRSQRARRSTWKILEQASQQPPQKRRRVEPSETAGELASRVVDEPVIGSHSNLDLDSDSDASQAGFVETEEDSMGLFRRYTMLPSKDPDSYLTIHHVADAPTFVRDGVSPYNPLAGFGPHAADNSSPDGLAKTPYYTPFLNATVFRLMNWFYQSSKKTLADLENLVHNVILHPDFRSADLENFSATRESRRLEKSVNTSDSDLSYLNNDDWKEAVIKVPLPLSRTRYASEDDAHMLEVNFVHRSLGEVIKSGIQDFASSHFHWRGFKQFWRPSEGEPEQRVYGEVYTSDIFLEMESKLPDIEGCTLEKAVVPLLVYSDSTHLANFGTASLWPIYIWFGNISKYIRIKASSFAAHHLAYLPLVCI